MSRVTGIVLTCSAEASIVNGDNMINGYMTITMQY